MFIVQAKGSKPNDIGYRKFDSEGKAFTFAREIVEKHGFECYVWDCANNSIVLKLYNRYSATPTWV